MLRILTPRQLKRRSEFYRELAALLGAGVPILEALQAIQRHPPGPALRALTDHVLSRIRSGGSLADALVDAPVEVAPLDAALLHAGEQSGRLVESCRSLSDDYAGRAALAESFLARILYPAFLLHFAVLVFPAERLSALFLHGDMAGFVGQKALVLGPLYAAVLAVVLALQSPSTAWRGFLEWLLHWIPGLGGARRERALSRLAAALEALLNAGVTVIEAWDLAVVASGSPALGRAVARWKPRVLAGSLPGEEVRQCSEFPELFASLYHTGEATGQLDHELRHLRDYYRESSRRKMEQFMVVSSLLVYVGIMLGIAFFVVRFWLGYFQRLTNPF